MEAAVRRDHHARSGLAWRGATDRRDRHQRANARASRPSPRHLGQIRIGSISTTTQQASDSTEVAGSGPTANHGRANGRTKSEDKTGTSSTSRIAPASPRGTLGVAGSASDARAVSPLAETVGAVGCLASDGRTNLAGEAKAAALAARFGERGSITSATSGAIWRSGNGRGAPSGWTSTGSAPSRKRADLVEGPYSVGLKHHDHLLMMPAPDPFRFMCHWKRLKKEKAEACPSVAGGVSFHWTSMPIPEPP